MPYLAAQALSGKTFQSGNNSHPSPAEQSFWAVHTLWCGSAWPSRACRTIQAHLWGVSATCVGNYCKAENSLLPSFLLWCSSLQICTHIPRNRPYFCIDRPILRSQDSDATELEMKLGAERGQQLLQLCGSYMLRRFVSLGMIWICKSIRHRPARNPSKQADKRESICINRSV